MRKGAVIVWLVILSAGIIFLFWRNEWVYALPTPVPRDYKPVNGGEFIDLRGKIQFHGKPLFLHFFNPDCPCSRFNIGHFKSMVKHYGDKVTFAIVVMAKDKDYTTAYIRDKFGLNIPVLFDTSLAKACGVYSTPQVVIIQQDGKLFYRGNYNKSRYCTDKKSNYAQFALEALLQQNLHPVFSQFALTAYGCQLPKCIK